jgi:hypothetical protein
MRTDDFPARNVSSEQRLELLFDDVRHELQRLNENLETLTQEARADES